MSAQGQAAYLSLIIMPAAQLTCMTSSRGLQTHLMQTHLMQTHLLSLLRVQAHCCKHLPPAGRLLWVSTDPSSCFACRSSAISQYPAQLQMSAVSHSLHSADMIAEREEGSCDRAALCACRAGFYGTSQEVSRSGSLCASQSPGTRSYRLHQL